MNKKTKLSKYILFISAFTLIAVIVLVVQSGYNNLMNKSSSIPDELNTTPLVTKLNLKIIEDIKKTKEYTTSDLIVIPTETVDQTASESATPNE